MKKHLYSQFYLVLVILLIISISEAVTINIPSDYATIQEGIGASLNGDIVLVQPGTYVENINFLGKNITVTSLYYTAQDTSYITQTVIDGNNDGHTVKFSSGENSNCSLIGFTIQNGNAQGSNNLANGGGIFCNNSSPLLKRLIVKNNFADIHGGGIFLLNSNASIVSCQIVLNEILNAPINNLSYNGAGIGIHYSDVTISESLICNNKRAGLGGGIGALNSDIKIERCAIYENTAKSGGYDLGGRMSSFELWNTLLYSQAANTNSIELWSNDLTVYNSILYRCKIKCYLFGGGSDSNIIIDYSMFNNINIINYGSSYNLSLLDHNVVTPNPDWVDALTHDFNLQSTSLCIDAGDPESILDPDFTISDIGPYYFRQVEPTIISITDIPDDQGRQVQMIWDKSPLDYPYNINFFYSIWRQDDILTRENTILINNLSHFRDLISNRTNEKIILERDNEIWSFIGQLPAMQSQQYAIVTPTIKDSTLANLNQSIFKVVFHNLDGYYESPSESGYSADNIPPNQIEQIATTINEDQYILNWEEITEGSSEGNSYPEINGIWYNIYCSDYPEFVCNESTYLSTTEDPNYIYTLVGDDKKFFKIKASDQPPIED